MESCGERFAGHGPLERLGEVAIEKGDEGFDAGLQVFFAIGSEAGTAKEFAREDGEPDLDLVEPGSVFGREVKADPVTLIAQKNFARGPLKQARPTCPFRRGRPRRRTSERPDAPRFPRHSLTSHLGARS